LHNYSFVKTSLLVSLMLILFSCCNGDNSGSDIGTRAADFLSPEPYTELVVEMHAVKGFSYDPTFESLALEEIKQIIDKPGGITVRFFDDIEPASDENHVYSLNEIRNILVHGCACGPCGEVH